MSREATEARQTLNEAEVMGVVGTVEAYEAQSALIGAGA